MGVMITFGDRTESPTLKISFWYGAKYRLSSQTSRSVVRSNTLW